MIDDVGLLEALTKGWAGDISALLSIYDKDCTFTDKAFDLSHHGHDGIRKVHAFSYAIMPDFSVTYGQAAFTKTTGAVEWVFAGTFSGEFEDAQISGTAVRIEGVSFMTFANDLILTNTDYWNLDHLRKQLR